MNLKKKGVTRACSFEISCGGTSHDFEIRCVGSGGGIGGKFTERRWRSDFVFSFIFM